MKNAETHLPDEKVITVYTTTDEVLCSLIVNLLLDHKIKAHIAGGRQAGFTGTLPIEIMVRECDSVAAAQLIETHFPEG